MAKVSALILTEGGKKIGFGHITRCCALRDALKKEKVLTNLIVNGDSLVRTQFCGEVDRILKWTDPRCLKKLLGEADIVIVDSYLAPHALYEMISKTVLVPVYVDDFVRLSYPRGVVVNGAIGSEKFSYFKGKEIQYLLGPKYALLRKDFWEVPQKKIRKAIRDVLITFGGVRRIRFINRLLGFLSSKLPDWRFHVVVAQQRCAVLTANRHICFYGGLSAKEMKILMSRCDIALSGGGQTTNELSRCGLPTVGICFADNQKLNLRGWERTGFLKYAGDFPVLGLEERILGMICQMNQPIRQRMSSVGRQFIDGRGAERVALSILELVAKKKQERLNAL